MKKLEAEKKEMEVMDEFDTLVSSPLMFEFETPPTTPSKTTPTVQPPSSVATNSGPSLPAIAISQPSGSSSIVNSSMATTHSMATSSLPDDFLGLSEEDEMKIAVEESLKVQVCLS